MTLTTARPSSSARWISATLLTATAALCSACVFAPPSSTYTNDPAAITKMSEQAVATCGAGQVKEVNAKSFTCK